MSGEDLSAIPRLKNAAIPADPALRVLSLATLINTVGLKVFMTIEVCYFTQHVGLSPATVSIGEPFSFVALKDKKYMAATLLNGVMSFHFVLQNVTIPL